MSGLSLRNTQAGVLLLLAMAGAPAPAAAAPVCSPTLFIEAASYPAGATTRAVAVADINGDTRPDVVAATVNPDYVAVLLNDGSGGLEPPLLTAIGDDPVAVAAADLRGNGVLDVVVQSYNGVYVLPGHGDGTFDAPVFYWSQLYGGSAMTLGTFDANGTLDILFATSYANQFALLPGNGDGTFGAPIVTANVPGTVSVTSGDFDEDGHLDLVLSTQGSTVSLYRGTGDGTFQPPSSFIAGANLGGVASGDFDGNGHLDIAVGSGDYVSVLLGNGTGGFQAALQYPAGTAAGSLAVGDLDGDGSADIVVAELIEPFNLGTTVSLLRGRGDGSFDFGEPYLSGGTANLALADLDGDSRLDVVTGGGPVFVLRGAPGGSLLAAPASPLVTPANPVIAVADWNGDGRSDLAWPYGNYVILVEAGQGGRFEQAGRLDLGSTGWQPTAVATGHFFGPETWDLVVSTYVNSFLFRGNGDGTFQDPLEILNGNSQNAVAVGDFDGDGKDDLVVSQGCCGSATLMTMLGNGGGTFQPPVPTFVASDVSGIFAAALAVNAPPAGHDDLVVTGSQGVLVLRSMGGGAFAVSATIPAGGTTLAAVGNFDGGAPDLLIAAGEANVQLYPGNGDGTFQSPTTIALESPAGGLTTGDYDGDSNQDFAVQSNGISFLFLGLGNRHFQSPLPLSLGYSTSALVTADFVGNGLPDIAAMVFEGIATLRNSRLAASIGGDRSVLVGSPATFSVSAAGYGPVSYQWRRNGMDLADGGSVSGSQTAVLTIDPASFADAGSYDVVVTDSCTSAASNAAELSVEFADVPTSSLFHDDIIKVATAGITAGCGGANYCPTFVVTRAQMSVFLLKSEHGSGYAPPACSGFFADVVCPSTYADWIEQLSSEGVTAGCGGGNYCPDASVTRAQMAPFLLKTSQGSAYVPPPAVGIFGDVPPGSFAADWIEDLYNRGITGGCSASPLLYCPNSPVNRQQMATFLVRTFMIP